MKNRDTTRDDTISQSAIIHNVRSNRGATLATLSQKSPLLVVFLRHAGCVFCGETLANLSRQRANIEAHGVQIALVHMSKPMDASLMFDAYDLYDLHRFSDQDCKIYRSFAIRRGHLGQLFGFQVVAKAIAAMYRGYLPARPQGDPMRLPGAVVLRQAQVIKSYQANSAADLPDFAEIAAAFGSRQRKFNRERRSAPQQTLAAPTQSMPQSS